MARYQQLDGQSVGRQIVGSSEAMTEGYALEVVNGLLADSIDTPALNVTTLTATGNATVGGTLGVTGAISGVNVTSGADPGHTHTKRYASMYIADGSADQLVGTSFEMIGADGVAWTIGESFTGFALTDSCKLTLPNDDAATGKYLVTWSVTITSTGTNTVQGVIRGGAAGTTEYAATKSGKYPNAENTMITLGSCGIISCTKNDLINLAMRSSAEKQLTFVHANVSIVQIA